MEKPIRRLVEKEDCSDLQKKANLCKKLKKQKKDEEDKDDEDDQNRTDDRNNKWNSRYEG